MEYTRLKRILVTGHKQAAVTFSKAHHCQCQLKTLVVPLPVAAKLAIKSAPTDTLMMLKFTSHDLCSSYLWNLILIAQRTFIYWIYLLPSTQQTIGCNGFCNDMFRLTRVIVRLCSEPFGFSTIVTFIYLFIYFYSTCVFKPGRGENWNCHVETSPRI
jgi:hypothetical protein